MHALVVSPHATIELSEVPEPVPGPGQVLVEVHHAGANFGELRHTGHFPAGTIMGFDGAGVLADGTRVVGLGLGSWAELAVYPADAVAEVPERVSLADAAALPTAGLTALRTLRAAGPLDGRRVLVTGASGGVGRLAVQLARREGAQVVAAAKRGEGLRELGAAEVVSEIHGAEPVDVVLELIGGSTLVTAWGLLKPGGTLISIGNASGEPAVFPAYSTILMGPPRTLRTFGDVDDPAPDLAFLLDLVARGELSPQVGWRGSWERIREASDALLGRAVAGKVVLDVRHR
ncbi:zinc-binding dehydrogenase [Nonomuraea sp. NPDC050556]|uniref:zinc-binding dehydrogenase n=1 Tax=Nonomuraea sp. NPDC050556 TaxID=3364369 RepID=UPI0037AE9C61